MPLDAWPAHGSESAIAIYTIVPDFEACGHRVHFLFDEGTLVHAEDFSTDYAATIAQNIAGTSDLAFTISQIYPLLQGLGTLQLQIDLTDAAPGSETWTDFGCLIGINGAP